MNQRGLSRGSDSLWTIIRVEKRAKMMNIAAVSHDNLPIFSVLAELLESFELLAIFPGCTAVDNSTLVEVKKV